MTLTERNTVAAPSLGGAVTRPGTAFALLAAMQTVLIFSITMLSPALPSIQRQLDLSDAQLTLASTAYGLSFSGLLLLGGRLADRAGRRRVLIWGVTLFGAASALAGCAPDAALLLAARFVQGAGAALAAPAAMSLLGVVYRDRAAHQRAVAVWGTLSALGATSGTLLSGVVCAYTSWRWEFAVPVVVSLVVLGAARRFLPTGESSSAAPLDVPGSVLITVGLTVLTWGLAATETDGWNSPGTYGPIALGVVLLVGFLLVELRAANPVLPLRFVASLPRATALWAVLAASAGMSSVFYFFSLYCQQVKGGSPALTSLYFLPFAAAQLPAAAFVGRAIRRLGPLKVLTAGFVVAACGLLLLSGLSADTGFTAEIAIGMVVFPLGIVGVFAGATVGAVSDVDEADSGMAGGVVNTCMEIGPTVGLAVLATVAASRTLHLGGGTAATASGYSFALVAASAVFLASALLGVWAILARKTK
ncbi:MFS transporter [Kitasatospora sp. NPDC056783]|uniref:MFS transporter n=1 Tax=Kitasatospora sp. NPDC056783 TaxID=3345943 RepID=UPI0036873D01